MAAMEQEYDFVSKIRDVPDFPKPGIVFKDITPLLQDAEAHQAVTHAFATQFGGDGIQRVVGIESRGFIFGMALAHEMGVSFVPIRKFGKLPSQTKSVSYSLEYGEEQMEIHDDALNEGDRILIIDDLLATGGTAAAACSLVESLGGAIVSLAFVIELSFLNGKERLGDRNIFTLVKF